MRMVHLSHNKIYHHKARKGDHPCFLLLNSPRRHVARGTVYNKGGVTLHTKSLPPGHHKVSVNVVQSHEEDSPLPVPIEDENLMTLRDAIGTYVAWPRSLINLPPRVAPPSSKGKGKEHFQTKESVTSPMKGSVHRIIPEEFAGAEGILTFKNLRIMVQRDVPVHVVENTYSKDYWGKEFKDEIGTNEIIEVTRHRLLSGSSLCFYISYLCEASLHDTDKASKFFFVSPFELKEKKTMNEHIVQTLQRYANQDHLVLVPCNVGDHWLLIAINTSDETVYYMDPLRHHYKKRMDLHNMFHNVIITYRTSRRVKVNRTKMHQSTWVNVQCPKQMNVIDCGYYVGLFVGDILQHGQTKIPANYLPKSRCPTFPDSKIQEFIREWCAYLYPKFLDVQYSKIDS
ncbi:Ulp1 protease family, C-terminal catalytic domain [Sesbania bispinosa]|nr:Ulp1 protease family, C-terminal catalytic domain [Sesbania bispinosa]